ncbi:MAG: hypothetical protein QOE98_595 [Gaiellaceae bacterium]|nr:hypothetical protein [Gaiellaceae bacterium]
MGVSTAIVKRVGGRAAGPAIEEISNRLAVVTRRAIDTVVRTRAQAIAADADIFRLQHPGLDQAGLERALIRDRARKGGVAGLASGLPSIVAGPGTVLEIAAAIGDAAAVTYTEVSLILQIAHLRGHDVSDVEGRRLEVLLTLGLHSGAVKIKDGELRSGAQRLDPAHLEDLPDEVVGAINRELAELVIMKFARRRAAMLAGRLVPLGIGVAVAGVEDFRSVGAVGKSARKFFDLVDAARVA